MNKNLYNPRRQSKPIDVKRRPRTTDAGAVTLPEISKPLIVHRGTDCFVTPPEVAARIVGYANLESGQIVYDPEAGTGNILQAIIDTEEQVELFGHELNYTLFESLVSRFEQQAITLTQGDFLAIEDISVDRFLMNPPYAKRAAYKHIHHARSLLNSDGLIIAVVPSTFDIDGMYTLETLPPDTFANTRISTKIIEIDA